MKDYPVEIELDADDEEEEMGDYVHEIAEKNSH